MPEEKKKSAFRAFLKDVAPGIEGALTKAEEKADQIVHHPYVQEKVEAAQTVVGEVVTGVQDTIAEVKKEAPGLKAAANETFSEVAGQVSDAVNKGIGHVQSATTEVRARITDGVAALKGNNDNGPKPPQQ